MRIKKITIQNYKGIQNVEIPFEKGGGIKTLVGLNESGKTSILRAIDLLSLTSQKESISEIVPKDKKDDLTDSISVSIVLDVNEEDKKKIKKIIEQRNKRYIVGSISSELIYKKCIKFEKGDSREEDFLEYYDFDIEIKKTKAAKQYSLLDTNHESYQEVIGQFLPNIFLFETLNSKMPEKIYLGRHKNIDKSNDQYRDVLESLFKICQPNVDLETIKERMISAHQESDNDDKEKADRTIKRIEKKLQEDVIRKWAEIFSCFIIWC